MSDAAKYAAMRAGWPFEPTPFNPDGPTKLGIKHDDQKRRYSLLPTGAVNDVVDVLEFGARKYAVDNWKHVDNGYVRYYDAALRHIDAWHSGEQYDTDSNQHHLAHAICCLMFLLWKDKNE